MELADSEIGRRSRWSFDSGRLPMEIKGLGALATIVGLTLLGAAIMKELIKPPEQRTWQGRVGGVVPYDFRPPTWERVKATTWSPDDPEIIKGKTFGVGWDVNVGAIARRVGLVS